MPDALESFMVTKSVLVSVLQRKRSNRNNLHIGIQWGLILRVAYTLLSSQFSSDCQTTESPRIQYCSVHEFGGLSRSLIQAQIPKKYFLLSVKKWIANENEDKEENKDSFILLCPFYPSLSEGVTHIKGGLSHLKRSKFKADILT